MKYLLLTLTVLPFLTSAQNLTNAISLSGGAEYQTKNKHAWNLDLTFNRRFRKLDRFSSEFGVNYSILEYKGDSGIKLSTDPGGFQLAFGSVCNNGYSVRQSVHYSRTVSLRIQSGINYAIIQKEKFKFSLGINAVNQLMLRHRQHGQLVLAPTPEADTLPLINTTYRSGQSLRSANNAISILLQPHVDVAFQLADRLWFTSRLAYYWQVLPSFSPSRSQLNVGVRFEW